MSPFCYRNVVRLGLGLGLGLVSFMFHTFFLQIVNEKKERNDMKKPLILIFVIIYIKFIAKLLLF